MNIFDSAKLKQIDEMDFPKRIENLINLASKYDRHYAVHGAAKHKYKLNPPTKAEDIRDFEKRHHIKIPETFFRFLTEVGNGGAGVDYGIYSLEQMEEENNHLLKVKDRKVIFEYNNIREEWNRMADEVRKTETDEKYDEIVSEMLNGLLVIGTNGCTYDHVLICEGKYSGMVGMIDWNLMEDSLPYFYGMDFENWICTHFRKIIQGDVTKHHIGFWTVNK